MSDAMWFVKLCVWHKCLTPCGLWNSAVWHSCLMPCGLWNSAVWHSCLTPCGLWNSVVSYRRLMPCGFWDSVVSNMVCCLMGCSHVTVWCVDRVWCLMGIWESVASDGCLIRCVLVWSLRLVFYECLICCDVRCVSDTVWCLIQCGDWFISDIVWVSDTVWCLIDVWYTVVLDRCLTVWCLKQCGV